jgi:hypothetical protein
MTVSRRWSSQRGLIGGRRPLFTTDALGTLLATPLAPLTQEVHPLPSTGLPGPLMPEAFGASRTSAAGPPPAPGDVPAAGDGDCARAGEQKEPMRESPMETAIADTQRGGRTVENFAGMGIGKHSPAEIKLRYRLSAVLRAI